MCRKRKARRHAGTKAHRGLSATAVSAVRKVTHARLTQPWHPINHSPRRSRVRIAVTGRPRAARAVAPLLVRTARFVAAAEGFHTGDLSLVIVGARAMATLHHRFLGQPDPTDVLTFDLGCDRQRGTLVAEILACADVAHRQAQRRGGSLAAELALYVTHGLLHLAGYDDHSPAGYRRMHAREDELLSAIGLGCVFAGGRR